MNAAQTNNFLQLIPHAWQSMLALHRAITQLAIFSGMHTSLPLFNTSEHAWQSGVLISTPPGPSVGSGMMSMGLSKSISAVDVGPAGAVAGSGSGSGSALVVGTAALVVDVAVDVNAGSLMIESSVPMPSSWRELVTAVLVGAGC